MVRLAHQVVALVVEGRVEEEAIVLDLEVAVLLTDAPLAEREELFAFGEGAHGDGPFFESDRHRSEGVGPLPGDSRRNCNVRTGSGGYLANRRSVSDRRQR